MQINGIAPESRKHIFIAAFDVTDTALNSWHSTEKERGNNVLNLIYNNYNTIMISFWRLYL